MIYDKVLGVLSNLFIFGLVFLFVLCLLLGSWWVWLGGVFKRDRTLLGSRVLVALPCFLGVSYRGVAKVIELMRLR